MNTQPVPALLQAVAEAVIPVEENHVTHPAEEPKQIEGVSSNLDQGTTLEPPPIADPGISIAGSSESNENTGKSTTAKKPKDPVTLAYVFDAQRRDLQEDFTVRMQNELIPEHNAECADIAREAEEIGKSNQARAKRKKQARVLRLVAKKWEVLNSLRTEFRLALEEIVKDLKGLVEVRVEQDPKKNNKEVDRSIVKFSDGSETYLKTLYIPYDGFKKA